ncbi:MAG: hypothetical protein ACPGUV_00265 [Polyangiales bacterium]
MQAIEAAHPEGLSVSQVVALLADAGERVSEASFRKYVQQGLLPRSVRVRRAAGRRGSQGLYPAGVIRQILHIRALMARGLTMEEIRDEFLFVRGDLESLQRQVDRVLSLLKDALDRRISVGSSQRHLHDFLGKIEETAQTLTAHISEMERRIALQAKMNRAVL